MTIQVVEANTEKVYADGQLVGYIEFDGNGRQREILLDSSYQVEFV